MQNKFHYRGATTLVLTVMLLMTMSLIVVFAAGYSLMQQKIVANQYRFEQAYEAAEAGIDFGIAYLDQNYATILANPVGGYIPNYTNSNTTNVTLGNNSRFSIVYSNPVANNYNLILVTSTGTNAEGTATKVLSTLVQQGSTLSNVPTNPMTIRGSVTLAGNAVVGNMNSNMTIRTGGATTLISNAVTTVSSGGSNSTTLGSDVQANIASLASMTVDQFSNQYFNANLNTLKNNAAYFYTSNFDEAVGKTNTSIWVDQSASYASNYVIGSPSQPVLMVVNGDLHISGNFTFYGFLIVLGNLDSSGNAVLNGAVAVTGDMDGAGNDQTIYDSSILNNVRNIPSLIFYARVPGSWKDF